MSRETAAWLAESVLVGRVVWRWSSSCEVHVSTGAGGEVCVWVVALGGYDPWWDRAPVRTRDGAPLRAVRLPVPEGYNAGCRLAQAMIVGALDRGEVCSMFINGVLVQEWTAQDIEDLAPGNERY